MALTAQNILDRASMIIQDLTNVRWPEAELTDWFNDCRRELAVVRPDIYSSTETLSLAVGAKQAIPPNGLRLMDVPRNTSGPAVTVTRRGFLDQQNPAWHQMTPATTIKHFMIDERDPRIFWVYPPAASGASVELVIQTRPTDYTPASLLTPHEELYSGAMVDYVCYRAFSKDSEYAGNAERSAMHYGQFMNSLKLGGVVSMTVSPNVQNVGATKAPPQVG